MASCLRCCACVHTLRLGLSPRPDPLRKPLVTQPHLVDSLSGSMHINPRRMQIWHSPTQRFFTYANAFHAGTIIWMHLLPDGAAVGDAFYFAVVTFLTIGYGDITPASHTAKVFFIIYTVASLIVQLTVVSHILCKTLDWRPHDTDLLECGSPHVRPPATHSCAHPAFAPIHCCQLLCPACYDSMCQLVLQNVSTGSGFQPRVCQACPRTGGGCWHHSPPLQHLEWHMRCQATKPRSHGGTRSTMSAHIAIRKCSFGKCGLSRHVAAARCRWP